MRNGNERILLNHDLNRFHTGFYRIRRVGESRGKTFIYYKELIDLHLHRDPALVDIVNSKHYVAVRKLETGFHI